MSKNKHELTNRDGATPLSPREVRGAWIDYIVSTKLRWHLTLNPNRKTNLNGLHGDVRRFLAYLDRRLLGANWSKRIHDRTILIGFAENLEGNAHMHAFVRFASKAKRMEPAELESLVEECWSNVVRPGSVWLEKIDRTPERIAAYVTKQFRSRDFSDGVLLEPRSRFEHAVNRKPER